MKKMTKRKTKPQSKKKRKTKTQSKNWSEQTATAGRIASVIADVLDYDVAMSQDELEAVADAMADAFEPVQDGRIYIEKINEPFLYQLKGTPAEYKAGLDRAIANGWLWLHESGTYVSQRALFARLS